MVPTLTPSDSVASHSGPPAQYQPYYHPHQSSRYHPQEYLQPQHQQPPMAYYGSSGGPPSQFGGYAFQHGHGHGPPPPWNQQGSISPHHQGHPPPPPVPPGQMVGGYQVHPPPPPSQQASPAHHLPTNHSNHPSESATSPTATRGEGN